MTYQPTTWKAAQQYLHDVTGLPWDALGLQHFAPDGGGYHEGNDLLAQAGRLTSDYSKRESDRDRPGTDGSSAIDVGDFDVTINGRRVRLVEDFNPWLIAQCRAGTSDTLWIREVIYTLDRKAVRRWDRLGIRSSGDSSHLYHTHISGFRDEENTPKVPLFQRFFAERSGATPALSTGGDDVQMLVKASDGQHWLVDGMTRRRIAVADLPGVGNAQSHQAGLLGLLGNGGQPFVTSASSDQLDGWGVDLEARIVAAVNARVDQLAAADLARDNALAAAVQALAAGGTSVDTAAVLARINAVAEQESTAIGQLQAALAAGAEREAQLRQQLAEAYAAGG